MVFGYIFICLKHFTVVAISREAGRGAPIWRRHRIEVTDKVYQSHILSIQYVIQAAPLLL